MWETWLYHPQDLGGKHFQKVQTRVGVNQHGRGEDMRDVVIYIHDLQDLKAKSCGEFLYPISGLHVGVLLRTLPLSTLLPSLSPSPGRERGCEGCDFITRKTSKANTSGGTYFYSTF